MAFGLTDSKMACGPSKWKMAVGLTNLKMAFGPGLKMFFWNMLISYF